MVRPVRQLPIPGLPYCVYLSSECIVVRGPDGTRRLSPRDVVSVKERPVLRLGRDDERKLILVTRDLLHVPLPVGDPKVRWGLKAILAARDGDEDELLRCVRWIVRETKTLPLAELRGETVWFRWSWLELDVGPPDRARKALECAFSSLIEESECWMARFDLMKKASPFKVAISVPMAPILVLLSFGAGGAKAVATKLGAKGKLVAKIASGAAVARLVRSVGRVLGKSLSKVAKTLAKLGVKPTLAKVIATVMTLCFGPLLTMTAVYWWLARRAYGLDPGTEPEHAIRGAVLGHLQVGALVAGWWCFIAALPVIFGHSEVVPLLALGAAVIVPPEVLLLSAYRRVRFRLLAATMTLGLRYWEAVLALGILGPLLAVLGAGATVDVWWGEAAGVVALSIYCLVRSTFVLESGRRAERMWLPGDLFGEILRGSRSGT
ncbi:hypothetical protein [Methanopyrus kandleri]